jgi:hypothetical protein
MHRRSLVSCKTFTEVEEVSDWTNRSKFRSSASKVLDNNSLEKGKFSKKTSVTTIIPRENNAYRSRYEKQPLILSPINVKFSNKPKAKLRISFKKK